MCKFCVLVGTLVLLILTLPAYSQETKAAAEAEQKAPTASPAKRPRLPGMIVFESTLGNVNFPHKVHQKMGCKNCHHQIHAKELITPHDEYLGYSWVNCQDCHNESFETDGSYYGCDACHHSNLENIADETLNAKVVVHKSCWNCHLSGTGQEASERCGYCHVKEEQPPELSEKITDH